MSFNKKHFISFHFISFHFISFHFISFHFISFHFFNVFPHEDGDVKSAEAASPWRPAARCAWTIATAPDRRHLKMNVKRQKEWKISLFICLEGSMYVCRYVCSLVRLFFFNVFFQCLSLNLLTFVFCLWGALDTSQCPEVFLPGSECELPCKAPFVGAPAVAKCGQNIEWQGARRLQSWLNSIRLNQT